jgi:hypothetical protein
MRVVLPDIALVRVQTSGGPYAAGQLLSLAFSTPSAGRLAAHLDSEAESRLPYGEEPLVPERIVVAVCTSSNQFAPGDVLELWFADPRIVRIARASSQAAFEVPAAAALPEPAAAALPEPAAAALPEPAAAALPEPKAARNMAEAAVHLAQASPASSARRRVRVRLRWGRARARRFIQVADKLFTVDRLGWYRHSLAMRLLVPDDISTGDDPTDAEATAHLDVLRVTAAEALGRPLLAAFMPNFSVDAAWLDTIDVPAAARAAAGLRTAIAGRAVDDDGHFDPGELEADVTIGVISRSELLDAPASSIETLLPIFIPSASPHQRVGACLGDYRRALIDLFRQTAEAPPAVRLRQMVQPNHALDDRLWHLVGAIGESFAELVVA